MKIKVKYPLKPGLVYSTIKGGRYRRIVDVVPVGKRIAIIYSIGDDHAHSCLATTFLRWIKSVRATYSRRAFMDLREQPISQPK